MEGTTRSYKVPVCHARPEALPSFGSDLSADAVAQLGLREGQSARVVGRAGRMVLVEAEGGAGPAVPWDRDLVLSADVRAFPLADLLQLVHAAGKSGFLLFQFGGDEKAVYLSRGEVVFAGVESRSRSARSPACCARARSPATSSPSPRAASIR
ncbi:MAG: DUF4388 domain-containing protein [Deltaproteobacteria bacterium]|nr:DUF4388 domain-containing protein [Deltaproteobacteria bacterium]